MDNLTIIEGSGDAAIADWLAGRLRDALGAKDGPVTITVPGGSTPFPIIAAMLEHDLDWTRLVVWPGDDRIVPEDHAASNTGRLRDLFEPAGAEVVTLTVMEAVPRFDLAWLGMGADGHIASLFPNTDPRVDESRAILRLTPDPLPPRSLTYGLYQGDAVGTEAAQTYRAALNQKLLPRLLLRMEELIQSGRINPENRILF